MAACSDDQMSGLEIRHSNTSKGKGLYTKRKFKQDEVLFSETPLVSAQFAWNTLYGYVACEFCMRSLETAEEMCRRLTTNPTIELPHPECCQVTKDQHTRCTNCPILYCSESCRQAAWDRYHQTLCLGSTLPEDFSHPLIRLLEAWRNVHYPPETCSIMLLARIFATVKQSKNRPELLASLSEFCKATVNDEENIAHKLLGEKFQDQLNVLRGIIGEFLYEDDLQKFLTPEGFQSLFALIGTNGQGIGTSSFSIWVKNCEKLNLNEAEKKNLDEYIDKLYSDLDSVSGDFLDCEGSGLYSLQSCCNHSCVPNAEVTFPENNFKLSVKALTDIEAGQEVFISYLDECARDRSRHSRQKILRENYLFSCQCQKCEEELDQPDMTSEEEDCCSDEDCMEH